MPDRKERVISQIVKRDCRFETGPFVCTRGEGEGERGDLRESPEFRPGGREEKKGGRSRPPPKITGAVRLASRSQGSLEQGKKADSMMAEREKG